jgi:transposase
MANVIKMTLVQSILSLRSQGWSQRRIAGQLGINRETVSRYVRLALQAAPPEPVGDSKPAIAPIEPGRVSADSKPASAPTGSAGPVSNAAPWRELILAKYAQGLSARRIHQDLVVEAGAAKLSYDSVRRLLKRIGASRPAPMRRLECEPGQEAQIDFGTGAPVIGLDGKRHRTHVFRIVLSHSRKAYSEACFRQTTEDFLRAVENAFWHFGGVPKTLVIDNLKAAVAHPDWFDPELNPKLQSFARHYGTVILPTKPRMARHKGKIERGIGYVKNNALKGHTFPTLQAQNEHLARWEATIADTRIHGTTKRQVGKMFVEVERSALLPLPTERFPFFHEAKRVVNRDGHIEVAKAYYSVPPEYLAREVWARWDARLVRVFNHRFEQIAVHLRREPGKFSTLGEHLVPEKINGIERGAAWLLSKAALIGDQAHQWAAAMLKTRGIEGLRVLQGLLALGKRHSYEALDQACAIALSYQAFRLKTLRQLLKHRGAAQQPLPFLDEHPLIRPLSDYSGWIKAALVDSWGKNQRPQVLPPDPQLLPSLCSSSNPPETMS